MGDRQDRGQAGPVDQAAGRGRDAHGRAGLAPRHRAPDRIEYFLGVLKAFALRDPKAPKGSSVTVALGIDVPAQRGRADSGDLEVDLTELFAEAASVAADLGVGIALFVDEMQDVPAADVRPSAPPATSCRRPAARSSWSARACPSAVRALGEQELFRAAVQVHPDRPPGTGGRRPGAARPAEREDVTFTSDALDALYAAADGYPYFVQAYGKVTWDVAASSPVTAADVRVAAPEAEGELAVGFFGSRYERATPAEREYMRAMAATGDDPVPTSVVADELGRKPSSLSPARDGLIKKGLIYSSERGLIAFTVPHFGKFLRSQPI